MAGDPVEIVRRDIREVVEAEIRRFLGHYWECEVVDTLHVWWHSVDESHDTIIHGLPCYVNVYTSRHAGEVYEIDCGVEYDVYYRLADKLLGWVRVVWVGGRCYAQAIVMDQNIDDVAREIVGEAEADERGAYSCRHL